MSFKQLIKEYFPNASIGVHSVTCIKTINTLAVLDLMIRSAFGEDIQEDFSENTTRMLILSTLKESDNLLRWGLDKYNNQDYIIRRLFLEDNDLLMIEAFAFVRNVKFRLEDTYCGDGELIDIHLYRTKFGWTIRQSFPLDD